VQRIWQILHKKLELPPELIGKEPRVAFYPGQKRVIIDNPCRILKYENGKIVVNIASGNLILTGRNLKLNILLPDSLEVIGELLQLEVEKDG